MVVAIKNLDKDPLLLLSQKPSRLDIDPYLRGERWLHPSKAQFQVFQIPNIVRCILSFSSLYQLMCQRRLSTVFCTESDLLIKKLLEQRRDDEEKSQWICCGCQKVESSQPEELRAEHYAWNNYNMIDPFAQHYWLHLPPDFLAPSFLGRKHN